MQGSLKKGLSVDLLGQFGLLGLVRMSVKRTKYQLCICYVPSKMLSSFLLYFSGSFFIEAIKSLDRNSKRIANINYFNII